jgi:hypothetical protein
MDENLRAALAVARVLDEQGVRWFLGGSLASSLYGIPRATLDADIVADLRPTHVQPMIRALADEWYVDEDAVRQAIHDRRSFNLIHFESAMKVDVFVPKLRRFDGGQFVRVTRIAVAGGDGISLPVCSVEDIVAAKLEWFRLGGEISDRQWGDIIGVLRNHLNGLNLALLRESATELGVADLLLKALAEAGLA